MHDNKPETNNAEQERNHYRDMFWEASKALAYTGQERETYRETLEAIAEQISNVLERK